MHDGSVNSMDNNTIKYLELVQAVIVRMAENSFLLKGWSVTLAAALLALAGATTKPLLILVALLPTLSLWGLDAYYLRQERLYRMLYEDLRKTAITNQGTRQNAEFFSLSTANYRHRVSSWLMVLWSPTVFAFHGVIVGAILNTILIMLLISH